MINIHPLMIDHVEKALGIKLYIDQVKYLTGEIETPNYSIRRTGSTTAYCIKLALSSGAPLDLRYPTVFSDAHHSGLTGNNAASYSKYHFLHAFTSIREKLSKYGFQVRELAYSKTTGGIVVGD